MHNTALEDQNATPRIIDFSGVEDILDHTSGYWPEPTGIGPCSPEGYVLNKQQVYRRLRRARKNYLKKSAMSAEEVAIIYNKPLAEWDAEELAHGRPRDKNGHFSGPKPEFVTAAIHEEAMERFAEVIKTNMRAATPHAVQVLSDILRDNETDNRGKPLVPASTKVSAAQFLIEHVVGKPTQHVQQDVSVKLQALLASVMVNPEDLATGVVPAHFPGITMQLAEAGDDDDELPDA